MKYISWKEYLNIMKKYPYSKYLTSDKFIMLDRADFFHSEFEKQYPEKANKLLEKSTQI
jgi:hypothetical protein